jgi:hypothetical protein
MKPPRTHPLFLSLVSGLLPLVSSAQTADTIYHNGPVITIDDANPRAEAVAVKDGKILAVGKKDDVLKTKGDNTKLVDLTGKTLLPGFVDAHGHVMMGGMQALSANLLAPPDGEVKDIPGLQKTLRDWTAANRQAVDKVRFILGFGYDNAQLAELRHPTRDELDAVSTEYPVVIIHQSGHLCSANSKALELCGITADSKNPAGGVIQRREGSTEPNGVLEETAFFPLIFKLLGNIGPEGSNAFIKGGTELWARFGYTTAQEGRSSPGVVKALQAYAKEDKLKIDIASYPDVLLDREVIKQNVSPVYRNRFRVAGAKLTIDGSPQGFTAWRDRPYYKPVGNYPPGYLGYPAAQAPQVFDAIEWAFANDIQILTHSNGEAASDQLIAAIGAARAKHPAPDLRPVLIHGQFLREDQVDSLQALAIVPSLFPMHTFYWGDWHRDHTVGPVLAENISPTGWCVKRGMKFTSHHDAPVAFPDSMRVLDATVTRRTRSGDILGASQRVDVITALKAMTLWPAWQHHEEKTKGSIEVGKLADLVILDKDPTAVDPETIDRIKVVQTIKEDLVIYDIADAKKAGASLQPGDPSELAFTRAMLAAAEAHEHEHGHDHAHGGGCLCGFMAKLGEAIATGNR